MKSKQIIKNENLQSALLGDFSDSPHGCANLGPSQVLLQHEQKLKLKNDLLGSLLQ